MKKSLHSEATGMDPADHSQVVKTLQHQLQDMRTLITMPADWNWAQDRACRFTKLCGPQVAARPAASWAANFANNLGQCLWDVAGVAPLGASRRVQRAVLDARQPFHDFEFSWMRRDDAPRYFSASGVSVFDAQQQFKGYLGLSRNITPFKHDQAIFQSLTRLSSDWYWKIDDHFRFTEVSSSWNDQFNNLPSDHVGRTLWELVGHKAGSQQAWLPHRAQIEQHKTFRNFEFEWRDRQGRRLVICISGEPLLDTRGNFCGYCGVGADITARRQAETVLRASEARHHAVMAALVEGVIPRDAEGRFIDCNASAERFYGNTLGEIKGLTSVAPDWQVLRVDESPMPEEEWPSVVARRTCLPQTEVVICYIKPDGSKLWALVNLQPLFDGSAATPSGFVSTITDISERKRAKMEIVRLNVELENRVLRRTAQLETINLEPEAFSYPVAHDLHAPLSASGCFNLLLQKSLPTESGKSARHFLATIRSGVQRMGGLTGGLLSLAQLSRTSLSRTSVNLSAEAADAVKRCAESAPERVVQMTVDSGLQVLTDMVLLRQVLDNLIGNAWKFTSKKLFAEISVGQDVSANGQALYFVKDNGAGFDMASVDKLFGLFQRLHSQEEFSGSGIGLATVQRIIDRHGGRVWATSSADKGSTFYFTLDRDLDVPVRSGPYLPGNVPDAFVVIAGNDQFRSVFQHASIGMALLAIASRRIQVNSAFCRMLCYSEAELLSSTHQDITHPDNVQSDLLQRKRAMDGEIEACQWEKRHLHQSGCMVWVHRSCSLVRDADHRPLHFISQIQNITERKQDQQVLLDHEESLRAVTERSCNWHWEQDENFSFVMVSGEPCQAGSVRRASMTRKTCWELACVNMTGRVWAAHKAQLERREVFLDFEITYLEANERISCSRISGVPSFDATKRFTGYRGIGVDRMEIGAI